MNKTIKQTTVDKYYYKDYYSLQKHLKLFLKAYHNAKHLRSLQGNTPFEQLCIFYHKHKQFYRFYPLDMSAGLYIYMMHLLEGWVVRKERKTIKLHANLCAENFYKKLGYVDMPFDDSPILKETIDLGKALPA